MSLRILAVLFVRIKTWTFIWDTS